MLGKEVSILLDSYVIIIKRIALLASSGAFQNGRRAEFKKKLNGMIMEIHFDGPFLISGEQKQLTLAVSDQFRATCANVLFVVLLGAMQRAF